MIRTWYCWIKKYFNIKYVLLVCEQVWKSFENEFSKLIFFYIHNIIVIILGLRLCDIKKSRQKQRLMGIFGLEFPFFKALSINIQISQLTISSKFVVRCFNYVKKISIFQNL